MNKYMWTALALAAISFSGRLYFPSHPHALAHPAAQVPPRILWDIARVESDWHRYAISPDGQDLGLFQLRGRYHRGVDLFDPVAATREARATLAYNRKVLGTWDRAITAYHRGIAWTQAHGVDREYVALVRGHQ